MSSPKYTCLSSVLTIVTSARWMSSRASAVSQLLEAADLQARRTDNSDDANYSICYINIFGGVYRVGWRYDTQCALCHQPR